MITRITVSGGTYVRVTTGGGGMSSAYSNPEYPELKTYKQAVDYLLGGAEYVLSELEDPYALEDKMYLQD